MSGLDNTTPRWLKIVIFLSRILATLVAAFLVMMFAAYAFNPGDGGAGGTPGWALILLGVSIGYLVAWKWAIIGGVLGLACLVVFVVVELNGGFTSLMQMMGVPGFLLLVFGGMRMRYKIGRSP